VYAEIPVAHNMVGIYAAVSTANHMAIWGGAEALLGTNPIAIGIPAGQEAPFVLDIATSVASYGTVRQFAVSGQPMPEGWIVNSTTGEPITDARKSSEGVLLPIGGHKGSGLAIVIGLLAGVLNGAAFGRDVKDMTAPGDGPSNTGQFMVAIDVARFAPPDVFAAEMDRQLADLRSSKRLPGVDAIRLPGEDRRRRRRERTASGVALTPTLIKQLDELATSLNIAPLGSR
jgi:LDH2 family malate/lactate/ureidoglycolate dehydrogenase